MDISYSQMKVNLDDVILIKGYDIDTDELKFAFEAVKQDFPNNKVIAYYPNQMDLSTTNKNELLIRLQEYLVAESSN